MDSVVGVGDDGKVEDGKDVDGANEVLIAKMKEVEIGVRGCVSGALHYPFSMESFLL